MYTMPQTFWAVFTQANPTLGVGKHDQENRGENPNTKWKVVYPSVSSRAAFTPT